MMIYHELSAAEYERKVAEKVAEEMNRWKPKKWRSVSKPEESIRR